MPPTGSSFIQEGSAALKEGKRVIWWNVIIGLFAAIALYAVTPPYQIFIVLFLFMRILAIIFEYMLYLAFRTVGRFTSLPGITLAWGAAFLSTVAIYSYEVAEAAFHYGMNVSPYYQVPPNIFQGIEGIALLFLGYYFGKLPAGYGKLARYGRLTHVIFGIALLLDGAVAASGQFAYLSGITVYLGIIMFVITVFVEYKILARTLFLLPFGNPSALFDPQKEPPRRMFEHLADFGYVRSKKQALGFYIAYLLTTLVALFLAGYALDRLFPLNISTDKSFSLGVVTACIAFTFLAFIILREKHLLRRFSSVLYLVLTYVSAIYGGAVLSLVVVAYLTTRARGDAQSIAVPNPAPYFSPDRFPKSIPGTVHQEEHQKEHLEKHLALSEDMTEMALPIAVHHRVTPDAMAPAKKKRTRLAEKKSEAVSKAASEKKPRVKKPATKKSKKSDEKQEKKLEKKLEKKSEQEEVLKPEEPQEPKGKLQVTSEVVRDVA